MTERWLIKVLRQDKAEELQLEDFQVKLDRLHEEVRRRGEVQERNRQELVSKLALELGLTKLPANVIAAGLQFVADRGRNPVVAAEWIAEYGERSQLHLERQRDCGSTTDSLRVVVETSHNVGSLKRDAIDAAKLKWHGKNGYWHGHVDQATAQALQDMFGDKVTIHAVSGKGGAAVEAEPQNASDGGGTETGSPAKPGLSGEILGAGEIAEKSNSSAP
jgi:hypothetical protein